MKNLIRLTDYTKDEILEIFKIADEISEGKHKEVLSGKTIIMFFPESSIRTRVTFEKGIYLLGGQSILFSPTTLDKKEELKDVIGYLNNWADGIIVRHKNIHMLEMMANWTQCPIINAMTEINHPCEILADVYALSKIRTNFLCAEYLFIGENANIGLAWQEASKVLGFKLSQACPQKYRIPELKWDEDIKEAVVGKDIICTDSIPSSALEDFRDYQITLKVLENANSKVLVNPCPPFYRGEGVTEEVIESDYFVGYKFKRCLLEIQQAILIYTMFYGKN